MLLWQSCHGKKHSTFGLIWGKVHILLNIYLGISRDAGNNAIMGIRNGAEVFPETAGSFGSIGAHSRTTYTDLNLKTRPQTGSGLKNTVYHLTNKKNCVFRRYIRRNAKLDPSIYTHSIRNTILHHIGTTVFTIFHGVQPTKFSKSIHATFFVFSKSS